MKFYKLEDIEMLAVSDVANRNVSLYRMDVLPLLTLFDIAADKFQKSRQKSKIIYSVFDHDWTIVADKGNLTLTISGNPNPIKFKTSKEISAFKRYLKG